MGSDETGTLAALRDHQAELIDGKISDHGSRIVKSMGDGLLVEFSSVVDAVRSMIAVQKGMAARKAEVPEDRRIILRIGVNLGDIIGVRVFEGVTRVDVSGVSKGRGFAGIIKRHGHSTGDKSHGGKSVRLVGSTGMHTDPGRVAKGKKGPGHFGNVACKTMNLEVVKLDQEKNLLLVKGAVPGSRGGYLYIEESLL